MSVFIGPQAGSGLRTAFGAIAFVGLFLAFAAPPAVAREAYIGNAGGGNVSVIDLGSGGAVGGPITVGNQPQGIAITPDGKRAYVVNLLPGTVSVIDTATNQVLSTIPVGTQPRGIAISPDGKKAYVANQTDGNVSVIDTESNETISDPIPAGATARGIAISPDGKKAYVGNVLPGTVSVIDLETGELADPSIDVGTWPQGIAITPDGNKVYVANESSDDVSVIDTSTEAVIETITTGDLPVGVAVTPDGKKAYVANAGSGTVSVIDTASDEVFNDPIDVGDDPLGVAITPDGKKAYVATAYAESGLDGAVSVIDVASDTTLGSEIGVGAKPLAVAITPNQPPLASLAPADGAAGQPVGLDASASVDPDGQIARYDWSFGDGQTALNAGPTPKHTYSAPGVYQATVTLTDSEGCSANFVFTGLTASCNGSAVATATATVEVGPRQTDPPPGTKPPPQANPPPQVEDPSNVVRFLKLKRNKRRGTAKLRVAVPGPGTVRLRGGRIRAAKRTVGRARAITLVVRPKRKAMKALKRRGRLQVRAKITFRPIGGTPRTRTKKLTLVRKRG